MKDGLREAVMQKSKKKRDFRNSNTTPNLLRIDLFLYYT